MEIQILNAIPQMVRDDEKGKFVYEDEFINNLFIYENEYIYFHETNYERLPKQILDIVVQSLINYLNPNSVDKQELDINSLINEYFMANGPKLTEAVKDTLSEDFKSIEGRLQVLETQTYNQSSVQNDAIDAKILHCLKEIEMLKNNSQKISKENIGQPQKISIGLLLALKESGYTVQEIQQLKSEGLI